MRIDLSTLNRHSIARLNNSEFGVILQELIHLQQADRKENQIFYYQPAQVRCLDIHQSKAKYVGVSGGNRSSKTDTVLAHFVALSTGIFPDQHRELFLEQFRGPISVRVVVESFTTTLYPTILPKLQWFKWNGAGAQGGDKGHWGWIPKFSLPDGSWERAWTDQRKILKVICRDPTNIQRVIGESTWQFMSKDQEPEDFASGEFHLILHDEPPKYSQWLENQARVISTNGRIFLAFTWPDDPAIPTDWIYDELYDKAQEPGKSPEHDWFEIHTTENVNIDQESVAKAMADWSPEMQRVRIYGGSMRFSNRIHPLFTDSEQQWCLKCKQIVHYQCPCGGTQIVTYNHVQEFEHSPSWPAIWALDPHPRKPHMFLWVVVDPQDDLWVIADGECAEEPEEVKLMVQEVEESFGLYTALRLMDPNMGLTPAGTRREVNWQDAFGQAGLICDLADDSDVGRASLNAYLKPDPYTERPRIHIHPRCKSTIHQLKRYTWDEHKTALEKDLKQKPKPKNDDYPTLLKYIMNFSPNFTWLKGGAPVITKPHAKRYG